MAKLHGPSPLQRFLAGFVAAVLTMTVPAHAKANVWDEPDDGCHIGSTLVEPGSPRTPWTGCNDDLEWNAAPQRLPFGVTIGGIPLSLAPGEPAPYLQNGRILVPLRAIAEAMGAVVTWDAENQQAIIRKGDRYLVARPGSNKIRANGWTYTTEVDTTNEGGRLFVPLRHLVESLGSSITWSPGAGTGTALIIPTPFLTPMAKIVDVLKAHKKDFRVCDRVLCLDRDKMTITETPAEWEDTYTNIRAANDILVKAREQDKRVLAKDGELYVVHAKAALPLAVATAGEAATAAGLAEEIGAAGIAGLVYLPAVVVPGVIIGLVEMNPDVAGLSQAEVEAAIQQAQAITDAAGDWQAERGIKRDRYRVCFLKKGDVVFGGWPGPSPFYTDWGTVKLANMVSSALFQLIQVPPNPVHGGFRPQLKSYESLIPQFVACGRVGANTSMVLPGVGKVFSGQGGGWQYFIPTYETTLKEKDTWLLRDWEVTDWSQYILGGGQ